jgi:hypothetical protein
MNKQSSSLLLLNSRKSIEQLNYSITKQQRASQQHRVRYFASGRYDEARCGQSHPSHQHGDCRIDLNVSSSFFGHVVLV